MKRVCVIFGGQSNEHEVSLRSATCVLENIDRSRYDVVMIGITKEGRWYNYSGPIEFIISGKWQNSAFLEEAMILPDPVVGGIVLFEEVITPSIKVRRKILDGTDVSAKEQGAGVRVIPVDIVFPVLHGKNGEDGTIQGLLELSGLPYVGCGVFSSAACMDKEFAHYILQASGVPKTKLVAVRPNELADFDKLKTKLESEIGYPMFVKPANAGSSVGVSKVKSANELSAAINDAFLHDSKVVVEQAVVGREIECSVIGNSFPEASPALGEILPTRDFYDYAGKYLDDTTGLVAPAQLPDETKDRVIEIALKAFSALDCCGLARVDFFVKEDGSVVLNELNTMPGFTSISMYPRLFVEDGLSITDLITRLIELSFGQEL